MIIVVDGPEKAGKSSIIEGLVTDYEAAGAVVKVRRWGPVSPDDRVYSQPLMEDCALSSPITIWDRSWASEHVYAKLLNRDRRLKDDPWLGEWLHSRAVRACGLLFMVLPDDPKILMERRDGTDLPVHPNDEYREFSEYADRFHWTKIVNVPGKKYAAIMDATSHITRFAWQYNHRINPPEYCGPQNPKVLFVGERRNEGAPFPGSWLPFSSRLTTMLGRAIGDKALEFGWTNCFEISPSYLRDMSGVETIVSCGSKANRWVNYYVSPDQRHVNIAHPAYVYRFNNPGAVLKRKYAEQVIKSL